MAAALRLLRDISLPLVFVGILAVWPLASYTVGGTLWLPHGAVLIMMRVAGAGAAGFLSTYRNRRPLWTAAVAGVLAFFVEQVLVIATFLTVDGQHQSAVKAVYVFVALCWFPGVIGLVGGLVGRRFGSPGMPA